MKSELKTLSNLCLWKTDFITKMAIKHESENVPFHKIGEREVSMVVKRQKSGTNYCLLFFSMKTIGEG